MHDVFYFMFYVVVMLLDKNLFGTAPDDTCFSKNGIHPQYAKSRSLSIYIYIIAYICTANLSCSVWGKNKRSDLSLFRLLLVENP